MKWFAEAPSNIALIKYMGRKNEQAKIPDNPSLSYTLPSLKSSVELEVSSEQFSRWEPLVIENALPMPLSSQGQQRFLKHLHHILDYFSYKNAFIVRSCNNFPQASGLASSASSFAALTLVAVKAVCDLTQQPNLSVEAMAQLSRVGSGSSCRSFFTPWALWDNETVHAVELPYTHLIHQVVIISREEKSVLSSQAHQQVQTSPFYIDRPERATKRLENLLKALKEQSWEKAYQITWDEFQDMHQLFETASPAFSYRNKASFDLLKKLQVYWEKKGDGPLITMDAGPNIHLLYRIDQTEIQQEIQHALLQGYDHVLST